MLLLALVAAAALPRWDRVDVDGWLKDGSAVVIRAALKDPDDPSGVSQVSGDEPADGWTYAFVLVVSNNGSVEHVFRKRRNDSELEHLDPSSAQDERLVAGGALWARAEPEEAREAFLKAHPLAPLEERSPAGFSEKAPAAVKVAGQRAQLVVSSSKGKGCRQSTVTLRLPGGGQAPLFNDSCAGNGPSLIEDDTIRLAPSPDGSVAAVAWNAVERVFNPNGGTADVRAGHGYFSLLNAHSFAPVDLLDSGAGQKTAAIAASLRQAGFVIGHQGRAQKPRPASAVYFTDGHEEDARAAAKLLGVPPGAVEKATWKTPFAVTVAAAAQ